MKKKIMCLFLAMLMVLPITVFAKKVNLKDYKTMNLKQTLADDEITEAFKKYSENDKQVPVYLFRGKGCGYCHAFLEFLNSITEEYGKYYKLVSFEVWYDKDNATLMQDVASFLGKEAGGVPFIVIGDQVFAGYASTYDDQIKKAITDLYNTDKSSRYDVFKEMNKKESSSSSSVSSTKVIVWNLIFVLISTCSIILFVNNKVNKSNEEIINLVKKSNKNK
jgi:glutaredoxin